MKKKTKSVKPMASTAESDLQQQLSSKLRSIRFLLDECDGLVRSLAETARDPEAGADEPTWIYAEPVRIPSKIYLTRSMYEVAAAHGFDAAAADRLFKGSLDGSVMGFLELHRKAGAARWANWQQAWKRHVANESRKLAGMAPRYKL